MDFLQQTSVKSHFNVNIVAPRKLRQLLNPIESSDNGVGSEKIFSKVDLEVFSGLEPQTQITLQSLVKERMETPSMVLMVSVTETDLV